MTADGQGRRSAICSGESGHPHAAEISARGGGKGVSAPAQGRSQPKTLPANHPHIAASLANLALVYPAPGRPAEAALIEARHRDQRQGIARRSSCRRADRRGTRPVSGTWAPRRGRAALSAALAMPEKARPGGPSSRATMLKNLAEFYQCRARMRLSAVQVIHICGTHARSYGLLSA
jgi:hypothetical protein